MGPKYEFTDETLSYDGGHLLHRIKRLSDGKIGGWIEKELNLSQEGNCWVDDWAKVYGDAKVEGNAQVSGHADVYGTAKVFGNAKVFDDAEIFGNAQVYGHAKLYGTAKLYGNVKIYDNFDLSWGVLDRGEYTGNKEEYTDNKNSSKEIVQDFIYKVDDSNKIMAQTEYDSVDEFFNEPIANDIKLDTLVIYTIDTKEPLIKLQKVETDNKTEFKFIVDITNEDGDDFRFRSIIKSQEQLNQLIQQTIEALKLYPKFSKYADDLENCE